MARMTDDVRHAGRRLRARPGNVAAAAGMLALGIGLTTGMFTIADTLLLRPVPFRDPDRLAQLYLGTERGGSQQVSRDVFRAWRGSPALEAVESASLGTALIETADGPVARGSATVTPGLFTMLDVRPIRGRVFQPDEGQAGTGDRILLSAEVWRSAFRGDPGLVGRSIVVDGRRMLVVGILPADFRFPRSDTAVWLPLNFDAPPPERATERPVSFVRFAAGIPRDDALRLATEAAHVADPSTTELHARALPLAGVVLDEYFQRAVPLLVGGVGLVFLVLCANVSSLLLVRLSERRREFSMCSALGATRGRLLRQSLVEHGLLGAMGLLGGIGLSWLLVAAARGFLPEAFLLRTLNPLNLDTRALLAASTAGVLATLAAGVFPAWLATRLDPADSLRLGDRSGTDTRGARSVTRALIVGEVAFACMLLVAAALLVRSFVKLASVDRGLDTRGVVTARISLPAPAFTDRASRLAITSAIEQEMMQLPGAGQVALSFGLPPGGGGIHFGEWQSDVPGAAPADLIVESYEVGADFFELYRIPVVRGRTFRPGDTEQDVIVGERLAAALWPALDPVGRSFTFLKEEFRVIGVAREISHPSMNPRVDRPEFYRPLAEGRRGSAFFMMSLRCAGPCPDGAMIRQRLLALSPAIRVIDVGPLEAVYFEELAAPRAAAALGLVFAIVAVLAAAGGLFGVLSYAVSRRRREFGIRTALGASPSQIGRLVLREGGIVGAAGVVLGGAGGLVLGRALAALQYGVTAFDPVIWAVVLGLLTVTMLAAAWYPARQAMHADPVALLKHE